MLTVTTGEGVGPAGGISPVVCIVCMLKNGLIYVQCRLEDGAILPI